MSALIALSGKGGVGKTTLAGMVVRQLVEQGKKPVLAIDADPNSCLDVSLGVEVTSTIGRARESVKEEADALKISKQELLRMKIQESLVEAKGFDLISMGRPEGAGCYCYANNVLKQAIGELADQYPYVVLDNEAGLENLSRRIVTAVDTLILISDASKAGIRTLERLYDLAKEMGVEYRKLILVINRTRGTDVPSLALEAKEKTGAEEVIALPYDEQIALFAEESKEVWDIPEDNPVYEAIGGLISRIVG